MSPHLAKVNMGLAPEWKSNLTIHLWSLTWYINFKRFVQGEFNKQEKKVCQRLVSGQWFSQGIIVSSINMTDRHDITEVLLKVLLNTNNTKPKKLSFYKYEKCVYK